MYKVRLPLLTLIVIVFTIQGFSQSFSITGEFKPRMEYRNGYKTLPMENADAAFQVNERTRLSFDYRSKRFNLKITPQHTGLWGQNIYNTSSESNFSIYEAYADLNLAGKELNADCNIDLLKLRMGRQELNYDEGRILSNLDWAPQGIRHDAAIFMLEDNGWQVHAGAGFNQQTEVLFGTAFSGNYYKSMQMIRVHRKFSKLDVAALFFKDDYQNFVTDSAGNSIADGINSRIHLGTKLQWIITEKVQLNGEFYNQSGNDISGNILNAQLYNLELMIKLAANKLVIKPGFDFLTGNDNVYGADETPSTTNNCFSPNYGINHKFYGFADYFYAGNAFGNSGLKDFYLRTSYAITGKFNTWLHLHAFQTYGDIPDKNDASVAVDPYLGTEVDWILNYTFDDQVNVQFGTCFMFGTETMKQIKGLTPEAGNVGNFTYLQFIFKPKFLDIKKDS